MESLSNYFVSVPKMDNLKVQQGKDVSSKQSIFDLTLVKLKCSSARHDKVINFYIQYHLLNTT